jgi:hypothetical protein
MNTQHYDDVNDNTGTFFKLDTSKCSLQSTSQEKLPSNDFCKTKENTQVDCVTAPPYEFEKFGCIEICKEKTACAGGALQPDGEHSTCKCTLCPSFPKTEEITLAFGQLDDIRHYRCDAICKMRKCLDGICDKQASKCVCNFCM